MLQKRRVMGNVCWYVFQREWGISAVELAMRLKKGHTLLCSLASFSAVREKTPQRRARFCVELFLGESQVSVRARR